MGSLPNLHELELAERKREKRREYELLLEQRARDTSRERERLSMFAQQRKQSSYNAYIMAGLGIGGAGGSLSLTATASTATSSAAGNGNANGNGHADQPASSGTPATAASAAAPQLATATTTLGGFAMLGVAGSVVTKKYHAHQHQHQHQHHHRHSLTTRHRVLRTRSSAGAQNVWDEQIMEHLSAYSPISTRSHRINPVSSYQVQAALAASRRRESINSSIGATSIRRLITLNNRNCRHKVPAHVREMVWRQFGCLSIGHGLMNAVLLPVLALQGSNSVWHHREQWLQIGPSMGSLLLSLLFLLAAASCLLTVRLIRRFGYTNLLAANYVAIFIFLLSHLFASIYTLLPAYMLLGLTLSVASICKTALIVHFGGKLSCSQHECSLAHAQPLEAAGLEEHKMFCHRDQKVRRLARWFRASQDLGLIVGGLLASLVMACRAGDWQCFFDFGLPLRLLPGQGNESVLQMQQLKLQLDFYKRNEHGERICGADMCPLRPAQLRGWTAVFNDSGDNGSYFSVPTSTSSYSYSSSYAVFLESSMPAGSQSLIAIYAVLSLFPVLFSLFIGKVQVVWRQERLKEHITDTLLFAGPLAYFVGTEQAYMLGDFLRAFVSCSLGIGMVAGALVGMGIMQLIVSCTLSMLLRHTKRIVVILAGFFFHSCLLLALSSWKPSSDDSALFYVIAAAWGACNGMWETLLLALVTLNHAAHVAEVTAPLQALRFLGLAITFAAHGFLCESAKIIALVILLVISVPPYAMLEIRLEAQRKATLINL